MTSPITFYSLCSKGKILPHILPAVFNFPAPGTLHIINQKGTSNACKAVLSIYAGKQQHFPTFTLDLTLKKLQHLSGISHSNTLEKPHHQREYWPLCFSHLNQVKVTLPFHPQKVKSTLCLSGLKRKLAGNL